MVEVVTTHITRMCTRMKMLKKIFMDAMDYKTNQPILSSETLEEAILDILKVGEVLPLAWQCLHETMNCMFTKVEDIAHMVNRTKQNYSRGQLIA